MNSNPVNAIHKGQQPTKEVLKKKLKEILDQSKQSIDANKYEQPTSTLVTTFYKPAGGVKPYFRFGYVSQTNVQSNLRTSFRINEP